MDGFCHANVNLFGARGGGEKSRARGCVPVGANTSSNLSASASASANASASASASVIASVSASAPMRCTEKGNEGERAG